MDGGRGEAKRWRVTIGPGGPSFEAPEDQPLLRSAEKAGWPFPSSCRIGSCGTCMQRVLSGEVRYEIDWPGVLPEEKAEGWVLPCVARPASDIVLE